MFLGYFEKIFILVVFLTIAQSAPAQKVIVNSSGERIIMFPDGSWRLAEAGDSLLLKGSFQKAETLGQQNDLLDPKEFRTTAEYEEYLLKQWNELHFKIKALEKKNTE